MHLRENSKAVEHGLLNNGLQVPEVVHVAVGVDVVVGLDAEVVVGVDPLAAASLPSELVTVIDDEYKILYSSVHIHESKVLHKTEVT